MATDDTKVKYINHLLNVDKFNGYHEGRIGPVIYLLVALFIPAFFLPSLYVFLGNILMSPLAAIIIIGVSFVAYAIRMALILIGREKERVARYRKRLYSRYDQLGEYVRIKNIYASDGCIEYFDGNIAFMVIGYNGNADTFLKFKRLQKFFEILDYYSHTTLVQNTANGSSLDVFYQRINAFKDREVASDYLAILDHNKQYITNKSMIVRTAFIVYAKRYERQKLHDLLMDALPVKAYFHVGLATREEVLDVLSHQDQLPIDLDNLIVSRFATGQYYTSRVISFDDTDQPVIVKKGSGQGQTLRDFIPRVGTRRN